MSRFYFLILALVFTFVFFVSVQSISLKNYNHSNYGMVNSETTRQANKSAHEENYEQKKVFEVVHPGFRARFARSVSKNESSRWPSPIIPFEISPNMSSEGVKMIHIAILHYQNLTCLEFKPKNDQDKDYIYFDNRAAGCASDSVGRKGGRQDINLNEKDCLNTSELAIHETFHALGFNHEHNRPDRDDYVTIHWENILPAANDSFKKEKEEDVDTLGLPYDYRSIVHNPPLGGSINGNATISAKVPNQTLGSTGRLSELDVRKINILFKCNDSFSTISTLPSTHEPVESTTNTPITESTTTMKPQTERTTTMESRTESTITTTMMPQTTSTTTMKPRTESTTTTTRTTMPQTTSTTTMKPRTESTTTTTTTTTMTPPSTSTTTRKPQTKSTTTSSTTTTTTTTTTILPQTQSTTSTTRRPQTQSTTTTTRRPQTKRTTTLKPQTIRTTTIKPVTTTPKPETCRKYCILDIFCYGYVKCAVASMWRWVSRLWR